MFLLPDPWPTIDVRGLGRQAPCGTQMRSLPMRPDRELVHRLAVQRKEFHQIEASSRHMNRSPRGLGATHAHDSGSRSGVDRAREPRYRGLVGLPHQSHQRRPQQRRAEPNPFRLKCTSASTPQRRLCQVDASHHEAASRFVVRELRIRGPQPAARRRGALNLGKEIACAHPLRCTPLARSPFLIGQRQQCM